VAQFANFQPARSQCTPGGWQRTTGFCPLILAWWGQQMFQVHLDFALCYPDCVPRALDRRDQARWSWDLCHASLPLSVHQLW
jgi:hypothetical protein